MSGWRDSAACRDMPDLFHPPGTDWNGHKDQAEQAIAICARCPVLAECLQWALDARDGFAILGGTTPDQRNRIRANRNRKSRARDAGAA